MKFLDRYIKEIEKELSTTKIDSKPSAVGTVKEVKDGIVVLSGLDSVFYGEILEFDNGVKGFVIDLPEDSVGCVVLDDYLGIKAGMHAKGTGRILSVAVSDE